MGDAKHGRITRDQQRKARKPDVHQQVAPRMRGTPGMAGYILHLQRTIGNQATGRWLRHHRPQAALPGSLDTPRLQRDVEPFGTQDGEMYISTYGRVINQQNNEPNPVFRTREEAQKYDDTMRARWEDMRHGASSAEKGMSRGSPTAKMTKEPISDSSEAPTRTPEKSAVSSPPRPEKVDISQGLIHGTYIRASNSVDLHVSSKGEGDGLSIQDMLGAAQTVYRLMKERSAEKGAPKGTFVLHPTGAAIVKIVVQTLGEALGSAAGIQEAHELIAKRKLVEKLKFWASKKMSQDKLDPSVIPEHMAYLKSISGSPGAAIKPILPGTKTEKEFNQNMLENSKEGRARLLQYEQTLQAQEVGASLDISLTEDELPQIISLLATHGAPKEQ